MQVSGFTAISRVLGFLRDILIARYLGAGLLGDAFFSAFRFPNLFRRIFGEGAFNAAFVPMFGKRLEEDGQKDAIKFASNAFSLLAVALIALTLVAIPCMHWVMGAVVPGFKAKVEMPLSAEGTQNFSMRINGAREVYISNNSSEVTLSELRFIEETPIEFPQFWGDGERSRSHTLLEVVAECKSQKQEAEFEEGLMLEDSSYRVPYGNTRISLPKEHQYGWLEGTVVLGKPHDSDAAVIKLFRNHPDTFGLTVRLSQITFCYLLFMALVAHLSGVLNTFKIFGTPAAAPILLNVVFLVGLAIFVMGLKSEVPEYVLAWCVAIAGLLQFMMLYGACWKNGYAVKLQKPVFDSSMKRLFLLMGPGVLAAGIQQVNLLVGSLIASFKQGAISWLYYSDRVYQLPLGMIGIALGVVLLPEVTRFVRKNDMQGASDSMVRGMEIGLLITLPAAVAMLVIPVPIISVLFQRGEFSSDDALQAGMALRGFALGLPGYVMIKVLQPGFFARENTKAPMYMAGITVLVNIAVSLLLFQKFAHVGIAVATTVAAWVNVTLLARGLKGMVTPTKEFWTKIIRIVAASVAMGVLVWVGYQVLAPWFAKAFWQQCVALALLVGLGISTYAVLVLMLKVTSVSELKASFRRG